jgi:hypothetical protein
MTAQNLQRKLKALQGQFSEVYSIRLHRAISWIKAAEEQEKNQDLRLICLLVATNSLYAMDQARFEAVVKRKRSADFVGRLVAAIIITSNTLKYLYQCDTLINHLNKSK